METNVDTFTVTARNVLVQRDGKTTILAPGQPSFDIIQALAAKGRIEEAQRSIDRPARGIRVDGANLAPYKTPGRNTPTKMLEEDSYIQAGVFCFAFPNSAGFVRMVKELTGYVLRLQDGIIIGEMPSPSSCTNLEKGKPDGYDGVLHGGKRSNDSQAICLLCDHSSDGILNLCTRTEPSRPIAYVQAREQGSLALNSVNIVWMEVTHGSN